jgi:large subunit ribosomal protein L10
MTRQEKDQLIDELTQVLQEKNVLYLTDASGLDAEATTLLRRESFKNNITFACCEEYSSSQSHGTC